MDIDPDDVFRDDEDEEGDFYQDRNATMEMVVYLVDASPKMFFTSWQSEDNSGASHFEIVVKGIAESLKTQIINTSYDEVAICFFNTREKKNLQDVNGVFVYNVPERDDLGRITATLIREFDCILDKFSKQVGSKFGILSETRDNSLYNALWVAQALLRKGSAKRAEKRILLFTNEDDPFGSLKGVTKIDMMRTTLQRAQDAKDCGISVELIPLSTPNNEFKLSTFYSDLLGLEGNDLAEYKALATERLEDMKGQLRKRFFRKRKVRRIYFIISKGVSIEVNLYALVRPSTLGGITWLDSVTNLPLKVERSFFCSDTGAQLQGPVKRFQAYKNKNIMLSVDEISQIKRASPGNLRLLGFKPLNCLKDYHNLRPSTFLFPSDEEVIGSTRVFIALHRSMLRLKRFGVAFFGSSTHPQLVALVAQDEIVSISGQVEPPGMHMIYLPYSNDVRSIEERTSQTKTSKGLQRASKTNLVAPRATEEQIKSASSLVKRIDLKEFSVCQFANPALQRHYAVLQALALGEDEMPEVKDETLPDEEGLSRPGIVKALEDFKLSVWGDNYEEETDLARTDKAAKLSKKRKGDADEGTNKYANYDWSVLANNGELKNLTVEQLKYYLNANNLPVSGKKEALISRILAHMSTK